MFAYGLILHICLTGIFPHVQQLDNNPNKSSQIVPLNKSPALFLLFPPKTDICKFTNNSSLAIQQNYNQIELTKKAKINIHLKHLFLKETICTISKLLNKNPSNRPRAGAILYSLWLKNSIEIEQKYPSINSLFF